MLVGIGMAVMGAIVVIEAKAGGQARRQVIIIIICG
jgi:hypothetical protein